MVPQSWQDLLVRQILPQEVNDRLHDEDLIIARLVPDVVSREVTSQVNPVKLEKQKQNYICKPSRERGGGTQRMEIYLIFD